MKPTPSVSIEEILGKFEADILHVVGDEFAPKQEGGSPERKRLLGLIGELIPVLDEAKTAIESLIAEAEIKGIMYCYLMGGIMPKQQRYMEERLDQLKKNLESEKAK